MKIPLTIANILTFFRLISAPFLVVIAFLGYRNLFTVLLATALLTDALDGYIARKLNQCSDFGTRLDSLADLFLWCAAFICLFLLWPDIAKEQAPYAILAIIAFLAPAIAGFVKYGSVPSYHCFSAKFQAVFVSIAVFILLFKGIYWPFRLAAVAQVLVAIEEIAITVVMAECRCNIKSFWHALEALKNVKKYDFTQN
jgi:phosphatidylglycerophosphate synthase